MFLAPQMHLLRNGQPAELSTVPARTLSIHRRYRGTSVHTGQFLPHLFCDLNGAILEFYEEQTL
jgi:hypothetical protein